MLEILIMIIGVLVGFNLLKVRGYKKVVMIDLNSKIQLVAVTLIIFIMGINLGSMENFIDKMLVIGLQSLVFAIVPTAFSVILVYILSKLFIVKN